MNYKDVPLTIGCTVRVYAPPILRIGSRLAKKYPEPVAPIVESETVTGETIGMSIEDDPVYLAAHDAWDRLIDEKTVERNTLFALKDEWPPDEFDIEAEMGDELRYEDEDWQPRQGRIGRKLDWIEWSLLANPIDSNRVQKAINELLSVDMEAVEAIEDSF